MLPKQTEELTKEDIEELEEKMLEYIENTDSELEIQSFDEMVEYFTLFREHIVLKDEKYSSEINSLKSQVEDLKYKLSAYISYVSHSDKSKSSKGKKEELKHLEQLNLQDLESSPQQANPKSNKNTKKAKASEKCKDSERVYLGEGERNTRLKISNRGGGLKYEKETEKPINKMNKINKTGRRTGLTVGREYLDNYNTNNNEYDEEDGDGEEYDGESYEKMEKMEEKENKDKRTRKIRKAHYQKSNNSNFDTPQIYDLANVHSAPLKSNNAKRAIMPKTINNTQKNSNVPSIFSCFRNHVDHDSVVLFDK